MTPLAYTSIKPIKSMGNKTAAATVRDLTKYVLNEKKTKDGELVYSHACDYMSFESQCLLNKEQYIKNTGRILPKEKDILMYHMIQSFEHGEITPDKALEVGKELALEWTQGNHAYIVAVHNDKEHVHCHIIYDAVNLDASGKYDDVKRSAFHLQKLSDEICLSHGLSIIDTQKVQNKITVNTKSHVHVDVLSRREEIKAVVDAVFDTLRPSGMDELLAHIRSAGYEVMQRGGNYSIYGAGWEKPVRLFSNRVEDRDGYSKSAIMARLEENAVSQARLEENATNGMIFDKDTQERHTSPQISELQNMPKVPDTLSMSKEEKNAAGRPNHSAFFSSKMKWKEYDISKVIDIKNNAKMQDSYRYRTWAKVHNVSQLAKTFNYLQNVGATGATGATGSVRATADSSKLAAALDDIGQSITQGKEAIKGTQEKINQITARMADIKEAQKYIGLYTKTRDIFQQYKKSGYSKEFLQNANNEKAIENHRAAKRFFDEKGYGKDGQPFPRYAQLADEYKDLRIEKNALYAAKKEIREEIAPLQKLERRLAAVKHNVDLLLREDRSHDGRPRDTGMDFNRELQVVVDRQPMRGR